MNRQRITINLDKDKRTDKDNDNSYDINVGIGTHRFISLLLVSFFFTSTSLNGTYKMIIFAKVLLDIRYGGRIGGTDDVDLK